MARAEVSPTPNPNAMKFTVDRTFDEMINLKRGDDPGGDRFVEAVFAIDGVAAVFATNDFVTIARDDDADWDPIVAAVTAAAADHL